MRKKSMIVLLASLMLLNIGAFGLLFIPATGSKIIEFPEYQPIDIGYDIRNSDLPLKMSDLFLENSFSTAATEADIGTQRLYVSINYYYGYYFTTWMELMAVG
ncbi:MAG: hypothetical protein ACFE9P_08760, partial [Candidatus Hermodarchaeota archaeon]